MQSSGVRKYNGIISIAELDTEWKTMRRGVPVRLYRDGESKCRKEVRDFFKELYSLREDNCTALKAQIQQIRSKVSQAAAFWETSHRIGDGTPRHGEYVGVVRELGECKEVLDRKEVWLRTSLEDRADALVQEGLDGLTID